MYPIKYGLQYIINLLIKRYLHDVVPQSHFITNNLLNIFHEVLDRFSSWLKTHPKFKKKYLPLLKRKTFSLMAISR